MVVAEVPLWVVHSNATAPGPGAGGGVTTAAGRDRDAAAANAANGHGHGGGKDAGKDRERALRSFALLEAGGGGGSNGSASVQQRGAPHHPSAAVQRAPIYGVDVCGDRFATGGGDGTVRIWNVLSLFPDPQPGTARGRYHRPTPSDGIGGIGGGAERSYESSGESSAEEVNGGGGQQPTTATTPPPSPASSEEDDGEESGAGRDGDTRDGAVHDLSGVVRRKGKGGDERSRAGPPPPLPPSTVPHQHPQNPHHHPSGGSSPSQHRLLCTLSAHTGSSVLAVRFSPSGRYLASAGDDAVVCIYAQQPLQHRSHGDSSSTTSAGNLDHHSGAAVEHWTRVKLCRGHALDVVGLAWAPDDSHLVSCSLDSNTPIIVWRLTDLVAAHDGGSGSGSAGHMPHHAVAVAYSSVLCHPYKVLGRGVHTSTVKGVTFDPAGTYLASSGDDPAVCIWRAHDDWGLERRVDSRAGIFRKWNDPASGGGGGGGGAGAAGGASGGGGSALSNQSLFRRLSWSTDGAYICATNAVVKNKHVASTISREGWAVSSAKSTASGAANLVGHKQPVVASRHCPYLVNARASARAGIAATTTTTGTAAAATTKASLNGGQNGGDGGDDDDEEEPEYATLLALGDKRGFVTVWSTKKPRPVFKIQCSETRCTVTDLAWGRLPGERQQQPPQPGGGVANDGDLLLIVSLLDGQVVALRFGIPDELGALLKPAQQARVFQLRYGIDLGDTAADGTVGGRRLFVGENSGPKLIENALQFSLENRSEGEDELDEADSADQGSGMDVDDNDDDDERRKPMSADQIKAAQAESRSKGGKRRIQPLLVQTTVIPPAKKTKVPNGSKGPADVNRKKADTLENAMELAEKAASGAEAAASQKTTAKAPAEAPPATPHHHREHQQATAAPQNLQWLAGAQATPQIPHSTDRIHSVELPLMTPQLTAADGALNGGPSFVAACTNAIQVPLGSSGSALPCTALSISKAGMGLWKDQLAGASCCAIAASKSFLAIGTSDGCIQIYGTSPTLGWASGNAFRSHPPYVLGRPIVALHLRDVASGRDKDKSSTQTELLAVTSDGTFGVYVLEPNVRVQYKGSIMPAMTHMLLSADMETDLYLPKIARIHLTDSNRLLLLLSLHAVASGRTPTADDVRGGRGGNHQAPSVGAGGSLQGFVYDVASELWMRVADSRFVLSDFYKSLPSSSNSTPLTSRSASSTKTSLTPPSGGDLSKMDDSVRMGASSSSLQRSRRGRSSLVLGFANDVYSQTAGASHGNDDVSTNDVASRSHCEDRMACAVALGSAAEFEYWFSMYVKTIAMTGNEALLRLVVDMLLGKQNGSSSLGGSSTNSQLPSSTTNCWWLSQSSSVLKFDRVKLITSVVIPAMSKNRSLQRITNEISIEVDSLNPEQ